MFQILELKRLNSFCNRLEIVTIIILPVKANKAKKYTKSS